jgi:hypothetical protein
MKIRLCKKCGKPIPINKDPRTLHCSKECAGVVKKMEYRKCARPGCENLIPPTKDYRQKFCSHSCSAIKSNHARGEYRVCLYCSTQLITCQKKFCSHKCHRLYHIEFRIKNNYHVQQSSARKYYIYIRGHKCEECKLEIWRGKPIYLSLHHINGDFEDHSPENVKLLCGNCHPLTDTFGSKNWGNGRRINNKHKKKTYKAQKSI